MPHVIDALPSLPLTFVGAGLPILSHLFRLCAGGHRPTRSDQGPDDGRAALAKMPSLPPWRCRPSTVTDVALTAQALLNT